jgi:uncharacterized protein YciI
MNWYVVLLMKGPTWTADSTPALEALKQDHLAHLGGLFRTGQLAEGGTVQDHGDGTLRAIHLYRSDAVGSLDELRALVEADPFIRAGRLVAEYATWHVSDDSFLAGANRASGW